MNQESRNADFALEGDRKEKDVSNNPDSLDNYHSRLARDAVRDYMQKFRDLEWIPGELVNETRDGDNYVRSYRENGWPSNFDREAFLSTMAKWEDDEEARRRAEQPFEEAKTYENWIKHWDRRIERMEGTLKAFDKGGDIPENEEERDRVNYRKKIVDEIEARRERRLIFEEKLEKAKDERERLTRR